MVLAKPTNSLEALVLEHGQAAVVQKRSVDTPTGDVFWIAFHSAATEASDFVERACKGKGSHTLATVSLVDEEAGNPPVGKRNQHLLIGAPVLDARQFGWRAKLTPADAFAIVEDERGVRGAFSDSAFFLLPSLIVALLALRMEFHAPTATPHTVVALHERGKLGPGG